MAAPTGAPGQGSSKWTRPVPAIPRSKRRPACGRAMVPGTEQEGNGSTTFPVHVSARRGTGREEAHCPGVARSGVASARTPKNVAISGTELPKARI